MFLIATNTIKSFLRNKIVHVLLLVSILFVFFSIVLSNLSLSEHNKIIVDFSLMIIEVFWIIITLFFWANLIHTEKQKKTIQLIFTKNINKTQFLRWKFLGFAGILAFYIILMSIVYIILSLLTTTTTLPIWDWSLLSILFIYIKLLVILAILIFLGTVVSPMISIFVTIVIYIVWHTTPVLKYYVSSGDKSIFTKSIVNLIYYILPNFEQISIKEYLFSPYLTQLSWGNLSISILINIWYIFLLIFLAIHIYKGKRNIH